MTTPEPTETSDLPADPAEPADSATVVDPGKEAARYRRQLRETETERDSMATKLENMQRTEILRLARDQHGLKQPESLFAAGTVVADLLGADGTVDPAAVQTAAQQAISILGLDVIRQPSLDGGARISPPAKPTSWQDALGFGR